MTEESIQKKGGITLAMSPHYLQSIKELSSERLFLILFFFL